MYPIFQKISFSDVLLVVIVLVAALLRCVYPTAIPFTYDEFSALFRTDFASFGELIEKGVKIDGHPAGIQVFLFYWVKLVGFSELGIKLPFIGCGIGVVWMLYRLGKLWFNETVGLLGAASLATLQYPIMYSQIARPYVSGLFFILLMAFFWTKLVFHPSEKPLKNTLLFILSATLCAYNHHFNLLLAAIIGISGLFFLKKETVTRYILSGFAIFGLYLPHLPIFFYQLKVGGVGWLGKPHNDFILDYLGYCFHYSTLVGVFYGGLVLLGLILKTSFFQQRWVKTTSLLKKQVATDTDTPLFQIKKITFQKKFFFLSLAWFALPFLIGFGYSVYVSPVIQFSVLIFSFPFLLFALLGHLPDVSKLLKTVLIGLLLLVNIYTLVATRQHYQLFYHSVHEQMLLEHQAAKAEFKEDCVSVIESNPRIVDYYVDKHGLDSSFVWRQDFQSFPDFSDFLADQSINYFFYGCLSGNHPANVPLIEAHFPYMVWQKNYHIGNVYLFSKKNPSGNSPTPIFTNVLNFEKPTTDWTNVDLGHPIDSLGYEGSRGYQMDSLQEWGPTFVHDDLHELITHENNVIDFSLYIQPLERLQDVLLVSSLKTATGESLHWSIIPVHRFMKTNAVGDNKWIKAVHSIKLSDIYLKHPHITVELFLWNRQKAAFLIDDVQVQVRPGNPVIYGLIEQID